MQSSLVDDPELNHAIWLKENKLYQKSYNIEPGLEKKKKPLLKK